MRSFLLAPFAALALASCGQGDVLRVEGGYVRLAAAPDRPAAGYFTLRGGEAADRLLSVTSPVVIRVEMHDSKVNGGMMKMTPIDGGVEVPAGGKVDFAEGGRHIMLYNVNPGIVPPKTLPLIFTYASGERIAYDAQVIAAGTAAPE